MISRDADSIMSDFVESYAITS